MVILRTVRSPGASPLQRRIPPIPVKFETIRRVSTRTSATHKTLAAPLGHPRHAWPGAPHWRHRKTGRHRNVNYEPLNHEKMVRIRAAKVDAIRQDIPNVMPTGDPEGDLLLVSWGSHVRLRNPGCEGAARKRAQDRPPAPAPSESTARQRRRKF